MRQKMRDDESEIIQRKVGAPAQSADHGTFFLARFPGQLVRSGGMILAVLGPTLTPLTDCFRADPVALGQNTGALLRAGDLGADRRGCTGVRVNMQHRLLLSCWRGPKALKPVTVVYNRLPD